MIRLEIVETVRERERERGILKKEINKIENKGKGVAFICDRIKDRKQAIFW